MTKLEVNVEDGTKMLLKYLSLGYNFWLVDSLVKKYLV